MSDRVTSGDAHSLAADTPADGPSFVVDIDETEIPRHRDAGELAAIMTEAVRNAVEPAEAYRSFRGRDATIDALLRDRGFRVPD